MQGQAVRRCRVSVMVMPLGVGQEARRLGPAPIKPSPTIVEKRPTVAATSEAQWARRRLFRQGHGTGRKTRPRCNAIHQASLWVPGSPLLQPPPPSSGPSSSKTCQKRLGPLSTLRRCMAPHLHPFSAIKKSKAFERKRALGIGDQSCLEKHQLVSWDAGAGRTQAATGARYSRPHIGNEPVRLRGLGA